MSCPSLLLLITLAASPEAETLQRFEADEVHMGTSFDIVLYAADEETARRAFRAAFDRIAELDQALSDYDSESELSRLSSASPTSGPVPVSIELCAVLAHAQRLSSRSDGAFDVTVGPLTRLWRRARRQKQMPSEERLAEARRGVGFRFMKVDPEASTVELLRPGMRLDLGAIAKGYAGDEALSAIRQKGIASALINAGGDVVASDAPPNESGWRIGIAPLEAEGEPSRFVHLSNSAIATSGDAWQFVEIDGTRYSHILDPRTGLGLTTRSSVSVIAPTGMMADSLASTVSVLGPEKGLSLLDATPDTAGLVLFVDEEGKLQQRQSAAFKQSTSAASARDP